MELWMIIDEKDEVHCDALTLDQAERLLCRYCSDGAEFWMAPNNPKAPRSEHYIPKRDYGL